MKEKEILDIFTSIEYCLTNGLTHPAMIQIYTIIDIFGWMAYGNIKVKDRFTKWIEAYVNLETIKPIDLYAARCAILHTMTPESNLSETNKANQVYYSWGVRLYKRTTNENY